ncbi:hypothetical protein V6N13_055202 [Hibiscus sabdariffa]
MRLPFPQNSADINCLPSVVSKLSAQRRLQAICPLYKQNQPHHFSHFSLLLSSSSFPSTYFSHYSLFLSTLRKWPQPDIQWSLPKINGKSKASTLMKACPTTVSSSSCTTGYTNLAGFDSHNNQPGQTTIGRWNSTQTIRPEKIM